MHMSMKTNAIEPQWFYYHNWFWIFNWIIQHFVHVTVVIHSNGVCCYHQNLLEIDSACDFCQRKKIKWKSFNQIKTHSNLLGFQPSPKCNHLNWRHLTVLILFIHQTIASILYLTFHTKTFTDYVQSVYLVAISVTSLLNFFALAWKRTDIFNLIGHFEAIIQTRELIRQKQLFSLHARHTN